MGYLLVPWYHGTIGTEVSYLYRIYSLPSECLCWCCNLTKAIASTLAIKIYCSTTTRTLTAAGYLCHAARNTKQETHGLRSKPIPWIARRCCAAPGSRAGALKSNHQFAERTRENTTTTTATPHEARRHENVELALILGRHDKKFGRGPDERRPRQGNGTRGERRRHVRRFGIGPDGERSRGGGRALGPGAGRRGGAIGPEIGR